MRLPGDGRVTGMFRAWRRRRQDRDEPEAEPEAVVGDGAETRVVAGGAPEAGAEAPAAPRPHDPPRPGPRERPPVLPGELAARAVAVAARWRETAAATGPADRAAAEAGVRSAYRSAGLAEPEHVVWAGSPAQGAAAALLLTGRAAGLLSGLERSKAQESPRAAGLLAGAERVLRAAGVRPEPGGAGPSVRETVRTLPWGRARRRVCGALGPQGWAELWSLTGAGRWDDTRGLTDRIRTGAVEAFGAAPVEHPNMFRTWDEEEEERQSGNETAVRLALLDAVHGQHDGPWLAAFDAAEGGLDGLEGLAAVARTAGWWWPYERVAVVAERPAVVHRDETGRLHCADGPALAFPDGFALHAWRGMPMPDGFVHRLAGLTPERIRAEGNAELRRVMLEHYGYDRYVAASEAEPVHRDSTGVLWRIDLPGDEPVVMVEVVNSTAEPDGGFRTYWLRVPPTVRTAREAVAWTFGLDEQEYRPRRET